jgi:hypothetical protein
MIEYGTESRILAPSLIPCQAPSLLCSAGACADYVRSQFRSRSTQFVNLRAPVGRKLIEPSLFLFCVAGSQIKAAPYEDDMVMPPIAHRSRNAAWPCFAFVGLHIPGWNLSQLHIGKKPFSYCTWRRFLVYSIRL